MKETMQLLLAMLVFCPGLMSQEKSAGKSFRDCKGCPEMVTIPAGSFVMGTPETEPGRTSTEGPQKTLAIASFAAGIFDITKDEWAVFVAATHRPTGYGCAFSGIKDSTKKDWDANPSAAWDHLGFSQTGRHPVVCITWQDAVDYTVWLSKKTGKHYRLLSEAEWEYAARAGSQTAFYWGNSASHQYANYGADSGWTGMVSGADKWMVTSPVGSFPPNAFGLFDMAGNVLQYCADYFSPTYDNMASNGAPYVTDTVLSMGGRFKFMNNKKTSEFRMVRGGDWGDPPFMLRSGFRNWAPGRGFTIANYRSGGVGFRVARDL